MPAARRPPMHLQAAAGQPLKIVLDATSAAGWLWQAPAAPRGCALAEGPAASAGAGEGGAVQQHFTFSSAAAGTHPLLFELRRPWDESPLAVQPVRITVV
jgi:hypothetical protein